METFVTGGVNMGAKRLVSFVPELIARKGWDTKTFVGYCLLNGLGQDTAYRMIRGETNFTTDTLAKVADILGVSNIQDMIDLEKDQ